MKKLILCSVLALLLLVSCTTLGVQNRQSMLDGMGKDGSIVFTAKGEYLKVDRVNRVNVEILQDKKINGSVEGNFSRLAGYIAYNKTDLDVFGFSTENLNYYQPRRGVIVYSENDAVEYYNSIKDNETYISEIDLALMKDSDFALYSAGFVLLTGKDGKWSAVITCESNDKAKGLFSAIKASYVSYLTKTVNIIDIKELSNHFSIDDNVIYLKDLPLDNGYLTYFVEEFLNYGR